MYTITGSIDKNDNILSVEFFDSGELLQQVKPEQINSKESVKSSFEISTPSFKEAELVWSVLVEKWGSQQPVRYSHVLSNAEEIEQEPYAKSFDAYLSKNG
ncbi:MAG: hypothetical protein HC888_06775 [Candidatus Competibacteraceae bacterium]|nr:hypothetical protein [Candidatus Competibacteraceae bacterium]